MEVAVYSVSGKETGKKVVLDEKVFGIEPNDHAIYLAVKQYNANQRQGTHSSKEVSMLSGSTRKIKRQKGTGTARAGSIKSPIFRGGARVFGPQPRVYNFKLNKKLKRLARLSALTYKAQDSAIKVIEDINLDSAKTSQMVKILKDLELSGKKTLIVLNDINNNVYLSTRNLQGVTVLRVSDLNTYEILKAKNLVMVESSVEAFSELA
ncbi:MULTISPECIES: 50S ribosomal protein L4 [unclassified Lentimicrobium]|uniref:50S ribosomal protein L4 n=1 Tax=unclassified Lentimicrobium TaxID=2677434 RepID=UPI001551B9CA|nr:MULTISPECIES: 50S ribosomal protein L4 [unclassified Lentimicrobium]NPD44345.1 50S ribosomal protein L4 [Lentimicrobium sp. S6]NPD86139.1 50S ribosomal protein L4 [Lentimicrobium sp. L6]